MGKDMAGPTIILLCVLLFFALATLSQQEESNINTKIIEIEPLPWHFVLPGESIGIGFKIYNAEYLTIVTDVEIYPKRCMSIMCNSTQIFAPDTENVFMCDLAVVNKSECMGMHEITFNWKDKNCDYIFDTKTIEIAVPIAY